MGFEPEPLAWEPEPVAIIPMISWVLGMFSVSILCLIKICGI